MSFLNILLGVALSISYAALEKTTNKHSCDVSLQSKLEIEEGYQLVHLALAKEDQAFLDRMNNEPAAVYFELRNHAKQFRSKNFPFPPHIPILKRIVADLEQRQFRKYGDKYFKELSKALRKAKNLLSKGAPYKSTIRFVLDEYEPTLDLILFERHPDLKGKNFHRRNAQHMVEPLLDEAPDHFIFLSFQPVDDEFFVNSRTAVMNLVGIGLSGLDDVSDKPYGDKFYMSIDEFSYHDVGHAEFTAGRDLKYIRNSGKLIDRIVWEWESTRLRIKAVVDQTKTKDTQLAAAMTQLLFELLRERGFQFSLTVLKQELDTPKWTQVLRRKLKMGFYDHYGVDRRKFERLEEARLLLLKAVERLREEDQMDWLNTTRAHFVPTRITHTPALAFAEARLERIEICAKGPSIIEAIDSKSKLLKTEIREMISAQVNPTADSPFTDQRIAKIEKILSMKNQKHRIFVAKNKKIYVEDQSGKVQSIDRFIVPSGISVTRKLENIEIFEINQALGAEERSEKIAFTIRQPTRTWIGRVTVQQNLITGMHTATIKPLDPSHDIVVPLVEIRIDPL